MGAIGRNGVTRRAMYVGTSLIASCSALNLDEFGLRPCSGEHSECDELNEKLPIGQCHKYYCNEGTHTCEFSPRDDDHDGYPDERSCAMEVEPQKLDCDDHDGRRYHGQAERCDGIDNDCDFKVDEDQPLLPPQTVYALNAAPELQYLHVAGAPNGATYAIIGRDDGVARTQELLVLQDVDPAAVRSQALEPALVDPAGLVGNGPCLRNERPGEILGDVCRFEDLVLAATPGEFLAAVGIDTMSDAFGIVRVGLIDALAVKPRLLLGSPLHQSNLEYGLNSVESTRSGLEPGGRSPSMASLQLDGAPTEALVLWRSVPVRSDGGACEVAECRLGITCVRDADVETECPAVRTSDACGTATSVHALRLVEQRGPDDAVWLQAIDADAIRTLGAAVGSVAPGLVAWNGEGVGGYLAAFAGANAVELRSLFSARNRFTVAADTADELGTAAIPAERPSTVVVAQGQLREHVYRGAVVWRSGCADHGRVEFSTIDADIVTGQLSVATPAMLVRDQVRVTAGPVMAYVANGVTDPIVRPPGGGWLVLWTERERDDTHLMVARVAQDTGELVGQPQLLSADDLVSPFVYATNAPAVAAYGYLQKSDDGLLWLRTGQATCRRDE